VHVGSQRLRRALLSYSKGSDKGDSAMMAWIYGYLSYLNSMQDSTREIQKVWRMQSGFFFSSEIADRFVMGDSTCKYQIFLDHG
jgi:hypothetical protein